jgi:hypothetical protein
VTFKKTYTEDEVLSYIKTAHSRDSLSTIYIAMASFASIFGGTFEFLYNPHVPKEYKGVLVFKEDKWTYLLEEAIESITRFHHMGEPANDEEKAEQYKKIWDNSSLGEKLLGNLNVLMEHLKGKIMVTSRPDIRTDCSLSFSDKDVVAYLQEVAETYKAELKAGKTHDPYAL